MNIMRTPTNLNSAATGRVSSGELDALSMLGEQLIIDPETLAQNPELAKLIQDAPEGVDFEELLAQIKQGENQTVPAQAQAANPQIDEKLLAQMSKNQLDQKALEIGEVRPNQLQVLENRIPFDQTNQIAPQAKNTESSESLKSILMKSEMPVEEQKFENAEQASKAFIPQRKSIFEVPKQQATGPQEKVNNGLMDLNDFVESQSKTSKLNMVKNGYQSNVDNSLFAKRIESDVPKLTGATEGNSMKVTDLMLMSDDKQQPEQGNEFGHQQNHMNKEIQVNQAGKSFDISKLNLNQDVITQIQDYIMQAKASNEPQVQMSFNHQDLGQVDLLVQKGHGDQISIMINSHTAEGTKFFAQNRGDLLQTLNQSGLQIADFKLDTSSNMNSNSQSFDQGGENSSRQFGQNQQHASADRQHRDEDSRRRAELWDLFRNREAA